MGGQQTKIANKCLGDMTDGVVTFQNKNIWVKSEIGTGKTIIALSAMQELVNTDFKPITQNKRALAPPLQQDLFTTIDQHDKFFKIVPFSEQSLYYGQHHPHFYNFDIKKETGYSALGADGTPIGSCVIYKGFQKQFLIFAQNQVIPQYKEYIETQTSMTYYVVEDGPSFFRYVLEAPVANILLWNADTVDVGVLFANQGSILKEMYPNQPDVVSNSTFLKSVYGGDGCGSFNDFWIIHMEERLRNPFCVVCYDDFDLLRMETFYPIPSLFNMYIGSTTIQLPSDKSNCCVSFIQNKFVGRNSALRVDETQLQEDLSLPTCTYNEIICSTPATVYIRFKMLQYVEECFKNFYVAARKLNLKFNEKFSKPTMLTNQDFVSVLMNENGMVNKIVKLYSEHISFFSDLVLADIPYGEGQFLYDIAVNLKQLTKIQEFEIQLKKRNVPQAKIDATLAKIRLYKELDDSMFCEMGKMGTAIGDDSFSKTFLGGVKQFVLDTAEIESNKVECPFGKHGTGEWLSTACHITRCCSQPFNKEHINEVVKFHNGNSHCAFCHAIIYDIERHLFDPATQEYVKFKGEQTDIGEVTPQTEYLTKMQQLFNVLHQQQLQRKRTMVFGTGISEKELEQYLVIFVEKWTSIDDLASQIIENTYLRKVHCHGDKKRDFTRQQLQDTSDYINCLKDKFANDDAALDQIDEAAKIVWKAPQNTTPQIQPDVVLVRCLKEIIGENMCYIDTFVFMQVPRQTEELLQVIGRSRRIGRNDPITAHLLYYPEQKRTSTSM